MKRIWFFFLLPIQVLAQVTISGTVTDATNSDPVIYATIYINGTTKGTISNLSGQFSLEGIVPPCDIVFSHISYETVVITFEQNSYKKIDVVLNPKDVFIGDINVVDNNLRAQNLKHFKEQFLGTDYWGENAWFENDSVLVFSHQPVSLEDSSGINEQILNSLDRNSRWFVVDTKEPLIVNQPLLGYQLHVNLINYKELITKSAKLYQIHTLGYYYFKPCKMKTKRSFERIIKKRTEAYYNSGNHFCRSLYNNKLKENGYKVFRYVLNPLTGFYEFVDFEFDNYIIYEDNEIKIVGMKDKSYYIGYYQIFKEPMNLNTRKVEGKSKLSKIYFLKDTCTIRADGSRPDNSIMFGQEIGEKRIGAMIPNDFEPKINPN